MRNHLLFPPTAFVCLRSTSPKGDIDMASRTTLVLKSCRTRGYYLLRRTTEGLLQIISCGLMRSFPDDREITDKYGNTYSFGHDTTDEQITAILSVPTGEILTACNNVSITHHPRPNFGPQLEWGIVTFLDLESSPSRIYYPPSLITERYE